MFEFSEKMIDSALKMVMSESSVEMRRLTKKVIEAAHKDIKEDRTILDKKESFFGGKNNQFIAENYTSDKHLKAAIVAFAEKTCQNPEQKEKSIKEWETKVKKDGAYSTLKAEVDYKRVFGVGKSNIDKLRAVCGIVERAVKIAAVPAAIIGVGLAVYTFGPDVLKILEKGDKGNDGYSQGNDIAMIGFATGNKNLQNTGMAMDANQQFRSGNTVGGMIDVAAISLNNPNTGRSSRYNASRPLISDVRVKDNTYGNNEHGVSIAGAKIKQNLRGR